MRKIIANDDLIEKTPLAECVDYTVFIISLGGLLDLVEGDDKHPTVRKGIAIYNLNKEKIDAHITKYFEFLLNTQMGSSLKDEWAKFQRGTRGAIGVTGAYLFLKASILLLSKNLDLLNTHFSGARELKNLKSIITAVKLDEAVSMVKSLAKIPFIYMRAKSEKSPKAWVSTLLEVESKLLSTTNVDTFESVLATQEGFQAQAEQISQIQSQINNLDPMTPQAVELKQEKDGLMSDLFTEIKQTSGNPLTSAMLVSNTLAGDSEDKNFRSVVLQLGLTDEQEEAMLVGLRKNDSHTKAIIAAGAGSGKTRVIAGRIVHLVNVQKVNPANIMATSFTSKSASELKERVLSFSGNPKFLEGADTGFGTTHKISISLLSKYCTSFQNRKWDFGEDVAISILRVAIAQVQLTNDNPMPPENKGFFDGVYGKGSIDEYLSLAEDYPTDMGANPYIIDLTPDEVVEKVKFNQLLDHCIQKAKKIEKDLLRDGSRVWDWITLDLTLCQGIRAKEIHPKQLTDIEKTALNTMLSAGRGQKSLQENGYDKTFRVASSYAHIAKDYLANVKALVDYQNFFKSSAFKPFSQKKPTYSKQPSAESKPYTPKQKQQVDDVTASAFLVRSANKWFNIGASPKEYNFSDKNFKTILLNLEKYQNALVSPEQAFYNAQEKDDRDALIEACLYGAFEYVKSKDPAFKATMTFNDMLINTVRFLIADPNKLKEIQQTFKHIMVDEAQDLNSIQHLLFDLVAGAVDPSTLMPTLQMTADTYTLIGDDKQAIYEFRGANPKEFIGKSDTQGGDFHTKLITKNFRSGKNIVDTANVLISHNTDQIPMVCTTSPSKGEGTIGYKKIKNDYSASEEIASIVANMIKVQGESASSDYGIALRTNAELKYYVLSAIGQGIPYRSRYNPFESDPAFTKLLDTLKFATGLELQNNSIVTDIAKNLIELPSNFNGTIKEFAKTSGKSYYNIITSEKLYSDPKDQAVVDIFGNYLTQIYVFGNNVADPKEALDKILNLKTAQGKTLLSTLLKEVSSNAEAITQVTQDNSTKPSDASKEMLAYLNDSTLGFFKNLLSLKNTLKDAVVYLISIVEKSKNLKRSNESSKGMLIDTVHQWKGLECKHLFTVMSEKRFPKTPPKMATGFGGGASGNDWAGETDLDEIFGGGASQGGDLFDKSNDSEDSEKQRIESERRLAYVALTRGQDSVTIFQPEEEQTSRFITEACIAELQPVDPAVSQFEKKSSSWDKFLQMYIHTRG
jgi:superfamily I DNA/RNA helicase